MDNMREILFKVNQMEKENLLFRIMTFMKENGLRVLPMEMALSPAPMEKYILAHGTKEIYKKEH